MKHDGVWREPAEESHLYPGLCLHDNRVSGSITFGCTRLPLWAVVTTAIESSWDDVERSWRPVNLTEREFGDFLYYLLEQRGEFGRLLLLLADAERREHVRGQWQKPWWETAVHKKRIAAQLRRCLAILEQ